MSRRLFVSMTLICIVAFGIAAGMSSWCVAASVLFAAHLLFLVYMVTTAPKEPAK